MHRPLAVQVDVFQGVFITLPRFDGAVHEPVRRLAYYEGIVDLDAGRVRGLAIQVEAGVVVLARGGPTEQYGLALGNFAEPGDPKRFRYGLIASSDNHKARAGSGYKEFARKAIAQVERQLALLPTRDVASLSWRDNGIVLVADSPQEAVRLSDDYAPEHLELHVGDLDFFTEHLTNYGSLFVGEETTVAYGDKSIGTNHILPTSRAARYTGGVWVGKFLKTCTYQRMTPADSRQLAAVTERQCKLEHMLAHAVTARVRAERYAEEDDR